MGLFGKSQKQRLAEAYGAANWDEMIHLLGLGMWDAIRTSGINRFQQGGFDMEDKDRLSRWERCIADQLNAWRLDDPFRDVTSDMDGAQAALETRATGQFPAGRRRPWCRTSRPSRTPPGRRPCP